VGSAIARIVDTVLSDRRSVLTVSHANESVVDVEGTCISLPRLVGGAGVMDTFVPSLSRAELDALVRSAAAVREAIDEVGTI
jgi:L-lactate dehydrogenase